MRYRFSLMIVNWQDLQAPGLTLVPAGRLPERAPCGKMPAIVP